MDDDDSTDDSSNPLAATGSFFSGVTNALTALTPVATGVLSHGAKNYKCGFVTKYKTKEQPPLAPARC
jgi:hypothetical protein